MDNSAVGKCFRHFKGNRYRVLAIAKDSETLEPMVVYQALSAFALRKSKSRELECLEDSLNLRFLDMKCR